jgi:hypothetical protein
METISIGRSDLTSSESRTLIEALNAELSDLYHEPGANHFDVDPAEVAVGRGAFLVVRQAGMPVGCGAVRLLDSETAEPEAHVRVSRSARQGPWATSC